MMAADHADLVAVGPDGREAVRAGLKELERYGYLVRERLRRANGTLGEVVYSITDRPATLGVALLEAPSTLVTEDEHDVGFGAGIRRGVMAADQFTQIANGLFRDSRLSFSLAFIVCACLHQPSFCRFCCAFRRDGCGSGVCSSSRSVGRGPRCRISVLWPAEESSCGGGENLGGLVQA
ncbi:hypothetical protein [Streptomyces sp. MBT84]|uniref:hypothetical protein n=1 Tax=Streptomyces sp. MBT84 TaxID=1488414 RepID=UPI0035AC0DEF